jgi:hypothetical protein
MREVRTVRRPAGRARPHPHSPQRAGGVREGGAKEGAVSAGAQVRKRCQGGREGGGGRRAERVAAGGGRDGGGGRRAAGGGQRGWRRAAAETVAEGGGSREGGGGRRAERVAEGGPGDGPGRCQRAARGGVRGRGVRRPGAASGVPACVLRSPLPKLSPPLPLRICFGKAGFVRLPGQVEREPGCSCVASTGLRIRPGYV